MAFSLTCPDDYILEFLMGNAGNTWVVDMQHDLDDDGEIADLPPRVLNLALFFNPIISWMTNQNFVSPSCFDKK